MRRTREREGGGKREGWRGEATEGKGKRVRREERLVRIDKGVLIDIQVRRVLQNDNERHGDVHVQSEHA